MEDCGRVPRIAEGGCSSEQGPVSRALFLLTSGSTLPHIAVTPPLNFMLPIVLNGNLISVKENGTVLRI